MLIDVNSQSKKRKKEKKAFSRSNEVFVDSSIGIGNTWASTECDKHTVVMNAGFIQVSDIKAVR